MVSRFKEKKPLLPPPSPVFNGKEIQRGGARGEGRERRGQEDKNCFSHGTNKVSFSSSPFSPLHTFILVENWNPTAEEKKKRAAFSFGLFLLSSPSLPPSIPSDPRHLAINSKPVFFRGRGGGGWIIWPPLSPPPPLLPSFPSPARVVKTR